MCGPVCARTREACGARPKLQTIVDHSLCMQALSASLGFATALLGRQTTVALVGFLKTQQQCLRVLLVRGDTTEPSNGTVNDGVDRGVAGLKVL